MEIVNKHQYQQYREVSTSWNLSNSFKINLLLPMILFGSVGAITWAIRGTGGWDGVQGTILPGLTWGILWYYLSYRRGIDNRSLIPWLGLGLAIGGELGYGQYISWIMGRFQVSKEIPYFDISPWLGYLWLFICGIGWVAIGSILTGWVLKKKISAANWIFRIILPFVFVGLGWLIIKHFPSLIFPNYSPELYAPENCSACERTIYTNSQNFLVLMWWLGAITTAVFQKDKNTLTAGLVLGIGFGISFAISATWCLGYDFAPKYIDWWKMWEMSAGFLLGMLYAITWYWANKDINSAHDPEGNPIQSSAKIFELTPSRELTRKIILLISVNFLLFMSIHGASYNIGGFLGLYDIKIVDQYDWPLERKIIFVPVAIIIISFVLFKIGKYVKEYKTEEMRNFNVINLHEKVTNLIIVMAVVGAVTIWPAKIGVIYAVFLWIAIWGINRLNAYYNKISEV
jgi:hypothetical protein